MNDNVILKSNEDWNTLYIECRVPDKMKLASYVNRAKGPERTMGQFAEACGVSASTLSRVVNGRITKALSEDLIRSIFKSAVPESGISFRLLMAANGMLPKEEHEFRQSRGDLYEHRQRQMDMETKIRNIISTELLERQMIIQFFQRLPRTDVYKSSFGLGIYSSFALHIQEVKPDYWNFIVNTTIMDEINERELQMFQRRFMERYSGVFLSDLWEPEVFSEIKNSFVFVDRKTYDYFMSMMSRISVNTEMSVILIDLVTQKVVDEISITRKDGEVDLNLFKLPVQQMELDELWNDNFDYSNDKYE